MPLEISVPPRAVKIHGQLQVHGIISCFALVVEKAHRAKLCATAYRSSGLMK